LTAVGNERTLSISYMTIGNHFESINELKLAVIFYKKCLDVSTTTNDDMYSAKANESMGNVYPYLQYHTEMLTVSP
jgi:hypothetical protein